MSAATHLFVSDLHLDASLPGAVDQFLAFLAGPASDCGSLYILGDLFEAWIGDDDTEPCRARVCDALRAATAGGLVCHVIRGNRDFLYGTGFERRTGCRLLPDPVRVTLGAEPILVSHGDVLCTDDHAYQELRSLVRDPGWQRQYLALPLDTRRRLAGAARAGSRTHTTRARPAIMDVNEAAVRRAFEVADVRLMIHGHTHRPGIHHYDIAGQRATRIVLGDWYEQGSCLYVDSAGGYRLERLARSGSGTGTAASNARV